MSLEFFGIDPESDKNGSATVWVENETGDLVFQGETADALLAAEVGGQSWAPDHEPGIPAHESVIRFPAHMVPFIRKACDAAERRAGGSEL
jgi:hypothetical protein